MNLHRGWSIWDKNERILTITLADRSVRSNINSVAVTILLRRWSWCAQTLSFPFGGGRC